MGNNWMKRQGWGVIKDEMLSAHVLMRMTQQSGVTDVEALKETAYNFLNEHHELEYLEFMNQEDLEEVEKADNNTRVFIACKVGGVRLIDNILLGE